MEYDFLNFFRRFSDKFCYKNYNLRDLAVKIVAEKMYIICENNENGK